MKAALLIVLSLSAMAFAGPAFNKDNQIDSQESYFNKQQQQQQQGAMSIKEQAKGPIVDILKQWCQSSQMSQQELTGSFKKLVNSIKSNPLDQTTEQAVMNKRICQQGAQMEATSTNVNNKEQNTEYDAQAHELVKDVYMDALVACKSRECNQQLLKIVEQQSDKVDAVRASYYMTRLAVTEKDQIKSVEEIKQVAESFIKQQHEQQSELIERQKLFAVTSMIGKYCQEKPRDQEAKQIAKQVAKTIIERYLRPITKEEVDQYQQQEQLDKVPEQLVKKFAKRGPALRALANLPRYVIKEQKDCEKDILNIVENKTGLVTARQSAIECLEQNKDQKETLKQIVYDQSEPIEVRIAAYRSLLTIPYSQEQEQEQQVSKEQQEKEASQIINEIIKHCEQKKEQDEQFVLYVVSHLDNMRISEQPEHQAIKECIQKNKQHYMQIQVLAKKFKQQLADVRRSSRNYKLEQQFNQIESGLVLEGDMIYEDQKSNNKRNQMMQILPKLVRVNMSMPVMGKTVNVVEITVRQDNMDEQLLSALKLVESSKQFQSVSKVVDTFKSVAEKQQQQQQQKTTTTTRTTDEKIVAPVCDLTIKVEGRTVVYMSLDDFKTTTITTTSANKRQTRSIYDQSMLESFIQYLKRSPIQFNRGINLNMNERLAKLLDIDVNLFAGLEFESRATGRTKDDFEILVKLAPRVNFEAIVGPAKMSQKKLLQRFSTKTSMVAHLSFKRDELVDIELEMPMQLMDLFTIETQLVERKQASYNYLPESIYGDEDIYYGGHLNKIAKRSIFEAYTNNKDGMLKKLIKGKRVQRTMETPEQVANFLGLRGKLHFVASPKDMSFLLSSVVEKTDPQVSSYLFQVRKSPSSVSNEQKTYQILLSAAGLKREVRRQMRATLHTQQTSKRTVIKTDLQAGNKLQASFVCELVHDSSRQYSVRAELVGRHNKQWRHSLEAGLIMAGNTKSPSGRVAQLAFKPFVQLESSSLKRPFQLQGTIAYSQSPKSVISYELKCPTTGDFIQGKMIVDQRDAASRKYKPTASFRLRRSMQSPIELALAKDLTLTSELVAQVRQHAIKVHNMIDWNVEKISLQIDSTSAYKNTLKSQVPQVSTKVNVKLDAEQQVIIVERKNVEEERKNYRATLKSEWRAPGQHLMLAELRYQSRRQPGQEQVLAYKHQIEDQKSASSKQHQCQMQFEIVDTLRHISEKLSGRARVQYERKQKALEIVLHKNNQQVAKVEFDFESLKQHQLVTEFQIQRYSHKCQLRNTERQFFIDSRTSKHGQSFLKVLVDMNKPQKEIKIAFAVPEKRHSFGAEIKLASGQRSSVALQSPRFASEIEFSFENVYPTKSIFGLTSKRPNLKYRQQIKDLATEEQYWMDSALNAADWDKETSYVRFESPIYRADLEFDPREQTTKFGSYARSKRSIEEYDSRSPVYSNKNSALNDFFASHQSTISELAKLGLNQNKLWMLRTIVSSPFARDQLKQQAKRAFFQYVDRAQAQRHSVEWSPRDQSLSFDLEQSPLLEKQAQPMRFKGSLFNDYQRPSRANFQSNWMEAELEAKPFSSDDSSEDVYARLTALSRHRRSPFKKHESEWRYKKDEGSHKAWMKHVDSEDKRHELRAESERDPKRWAKVEFDSEKHGKGKWEHKWRKNVEKRETDQEAIYANRVAYRFQKPYTQKDAWMHESQLDWQEPARLVDNMRYRRSIIGNTDDNEKYLTNYLKHTSARLTSEIMRPNMLQQNYKLDFDYKPKQLARLQFQMPNEMIHESFVEMESAKPTTGYKFASKLYNRNNQLKSYDFSATTKPYVASLATADQEPVFVHTEHPMLERPISQETIAYSLFKQPMKLDYSDKYGRQMSIDYDELPALVNQKYPGLRQKRAAVFYKDSSAVQPLEHSSSYDFYPETFLGRVKPSYERKMYDDVVVKSQTKYGPIVMRLDTSDADNMEAELESPLVRAKLSSETGANLRKLIKFHLDNKSQRVQMSKLLRKAPETLRQCEMLEKLAQKIDSSRFEHDTELLVSIVDSIFKIKSKSELNSRPIVTIDGQMDQTKAIIKINGERYQGQLVADLMNKNAELVLEGSAGKHKEPVKHITRLVRTSDNFYTIESSTTYKQRPIFKLTGKLSAMIFEQPEHLLNKYNSQQRRFISANQETHENHISTFEAVVYEPKEYFITGMFDCEKMTARVECKSPVEGKYQLTVARLQGETVVVESQLNGQEEGQIYNFQARVNLPGLVNAQKCHYSRQQTCASELNYEDRSGFLQTKYQPGDYISVASKYGKQMIKLY